MLAMISRRNAVCIIICCQVTLEVCRVEGCSWCDVTSQSRRWRDPRKMVARRPPRTLESRPPMIVFPARTGTPETGSPAGGGSRRWTRCTRWRRTTPSGRWCASTSAANRRSRCPRLWRRPAPRPPTPPRPRGAPTRARTRWTGRSNSSIASRSWR